MGRSPLCLSTDRIHFGERRVKPLCDVYLSYDEKPGIQAIGNTADNLHPAPRGTSTIVRDSEYKRYGTLSILAGIDLVTGEVIVSAEERHRTREFVDFLKRLDSYCSSELRIQIISDNHSAHSSKASLPGRFEQIFIPKYGS
ncbi:transposase [Paenibacillus macerans]|uniref:transposase n=1 Tax=Paenibacillus macerans TaxID=44252 RepID=UPI00399D1E7F